jgi:serine/threonine protein kinase
MLERERGPILGCRAGLSSRLFAQAAHYPSVRFFLQRNTLVIDWSRSDLKPDNIVLDAKGHAHITDFNVAIHYSERRLHTSVAGSMAYIAPEVVGRKGYTWCVDWWSFGITIYELLFRRRPFDGRTSEKMTNSILKDPLKFPDDAHKKCSPNCVKFVQAVSANIR